MDAFMKRPFVRQIIPPPGFESTSSGGAAMHTNPFSFDLGIAPPYSTTASASSWSFSGGGDMGRRTTRPFSIGLDLARAPISMSDLCDDYFPRPAQFGLFPTTNVPHRYHVPATVGEVPASPVPSAGFNPTPGYHYRNPFDADDVTAASSSLAMEVPAPWDRCYDYNDGYVVQPGGVEDPAVSVSSEAPVRYDGGGTLNDDDESTRVLPKLCCCPYDGYDEDIEATLRAQEDEGKPSPDYLETTQRGRMSHDTRAALVGWMERFAQCYDLAPRTLHRAVSYADRFLSVRPLDDVGAHRLRLLGAVAVYAAAKYEDQGTLARLDAMEIASYGRRAGVGGAGFAASNEEVLGMERALLAALDYRLGRPTAYTFVEHFTRHYGHEEVRLELRSCAHDFADMSLLHYGCLRHSPSAVAAAAMFLARLTLKPTYGQMKRWNRELKELTGYEPQKLERCIEAIHSLIACHGDGSYDDVELFPMLYATADP